MNEKAAKETENGEASRGKTASLKVVAEALRGLQFGTVKLIVQDGVLVRIERTENRLVSQGRS
jgi:hypothetical protein